MSRAKRNSLTEEQRKVAAVERVRQWRLNNPEKARALCQRDYEKNKETYKARSKKWMNDHPEVRKARYDDWRSRNPEKMRGYSKKWRSENPEAARSSVRNWVQKNPEKNALAQKRWLVEHPEYHRSRYSHLKEGDFTYDQWSETLEVFNHHCAYCLRGDVELTMDHIIPVSKGGPHTQDNIVPACRSCNSKKNNRPIWVMAQM